jgi:hypothetical protein
MKYKLTLLSVLWLLGIVGIIAPSVLATTTTVTLTGEPHWLAIADVNGDGHLDIVAAATDSESTENWQLVAVRGYGNGTFYPAQYRTLELDENANEISALGMGFASGDTNPDVFFLVQHPPDFDRVYRSDGNGDGTFGPKSGWNVGEEPDSLQVFDRNGDGISDVAYVTDSAASSNTLGLRCGGGAGGFGSESTMNAGAPALLRVADVNGNGVADYVMLQEGTANVSVVFGTSSCTLATTKMDSAIGINTTAGAMAVGDVTGDGKADIIALTYNKLWISTGNGDGTFNTASSTTVASHTQALALADLDGDGDLDAVVTDQPSGGTVGYMVVYPNTGSGSWGTTTSYTVDALPYDVKVADMNEDTIPDLVVVSADAKTIKVILR